MEYDLPSGTLPQNKMKNNSRPEQGMSSGEDALETDLSKEPVQPIPKTPTGEVPETSSPNAEFMKRGLTKAPEDPLKDFMVPPVGTSYGKASFSSSGSFPWIADLSPMLDEIWYEESFRELTKEPVQAGNRERM